jgi:hypothetical protein
MIYAGGSETISKGGTDLGAQVSAGTQVATHRLTPLCGSPRGAVSEVSRPRFFLVRAADWDQRVHGLRRLVVQAFRHRFADKPDRLLALGVAFGLDDIVGVVEQDAVAALAGGDAPA